MLLEWLGSEPGLRRLAQWLSDLCRSLSLSRFPILMIGR